MAQHRVPKPLRRRHLVSLLAVGAAVLAGAIFSVSPAHRAYAAASGDAAIADASIASDAPDTVQSGTWVSMDASPTRYGYFTFDVAVPAGQVVTKAVFECWAGSSNSQGADVWTTSSNWSESTITWNNAPRPNFALAPAGRTGAVTAGSYAQADVTSAVTASGALTLVTRTASTTRWSCASRETTSTHPPRLVITTALSPTSSASASAPAPSTTTAAPSTTTAAPSTTTAAPSTTMAAPTTTAPTTPASTTTAPSTPATSPAPTSSSTSPAGGHKVLVVVEENHSVTEALNSMPYLASMAKQYGQATAYHAITHPSLPNYLAIAGGNTFGVTDDAAPSSHPIAGDSVFDQSLAAGKTAKTYAESMTSNCELSSSGQYAVKHNPWAYFNGSTQRANCSAHDVPMGTTSSGHLLDDINAGTLPVSGMMVPNLCNDAHDCALGTADSWLKAWLPKVIAGPDYTSGKLTIVVTFDEDDSSAGNNVAFVVVDPRLNGKTVTSAATHYSLTRWYDQNAGAPALRNAGSAADLKSAFGL